MEGHIERARARWLRRRALGVALAALVALVGGWTALVPAGAEAQATGAPKAYIGLFKDNAVAVLDTGTNTVVRTIAVPTGPHGMVVTPDGAFVYVSSDGDSKVSVIDTASDQIVRTIEVGAMPHGLAITPDGRTVLAAVFGAGEVVAIDTASNAVSGRVPVANPHNIAITPDGRTAYVASQQADAPALVILDLVSLSRIGQVPLDTVPRALSVSPDGTKLYFTQAGVSAVQVLDPASNAVMTSIPVGASPHHPTFTANGEYGLSVSQGTNELTVIDPATSAVLANVTVGAMPHWIATSADGDTAYVTDEDSGEVSVVDLEQDKVTATIPVGNGPRKIVVQPRATGATPSAPASGAPVQISGFAFQPATITVSPRQEITWTNQDSVTHTITSDGGAWASGTVRGGESFRLTLMGAGQYTYACSIHPFMKGTVVVQG